MDVLQPRSLDEALEMAAIGVRDDGHQRRVRAADLAAGMAGVAAQSCHGVFHLSCHGPGLDLRLQFLHRRANGSVRHR